MASQAKQALGSYNFLCTRLLAVCNRYEYGRLPSIINVGEQVGLSRLCSATFEQLLAFGATFCGFSNLEQVLPFRAIFEQNIGLEHISSTKVNDFVENLNSCEFLEGLSCYQPFEHITCHLTTFRRPNWPIVSLLFMNGNGW